MRASLCGRVRVVIPFVSDLGEVRQTRRMMIEAMEQLGHPENVTRLPELGVMIEVPSAVCMASPIAREADFLCVGTNDLIQYSLAVDRTSRNVAAFFQPLHPAVLQSVRRVIEAGQEHQRTVTICGEAACQPIFAYVAIGMGISHFSVNRNSILDLKSAIPQISFAEAQMAAMELLRFHEFSEVRSFLEAHFKHSTSPLKQRWYQEWEKALV
jgi:phosphoenolpyruvate-protein phosphotransferase (PTS system enzyme I)